MAHQNDLDMARAMLKGDERLFDHFYNDFFPRLYRFALNRCQGDEELTKDVVQTAMMNAMRNLDKYRGEASMFTWLCQICRNEIAGYFRKLSRRVPEVAADDVGIRSILETLEAEESDHPEDQYQRREVKKLVQEVLDFLPSNYGAALEMKYIEGYSVVEIASSLELTELAAQSILGRARRAFREALTQISAEFSDIQIERS